MAEVALGANCSACGTLVACAGSYSDERLTGVCPVCKVAVTMPNHAYVAPAASPETPAEVPFIPESPVDNPILQEDEDDDAAFG